MKVKLNHLMESISCLKVDDDLISNIAKVIENTQVLATRRQILAHILGAAGS